MSRSMIERINDALHARTGGDLFSGVELPKERRAVVVTPRQSLFPIAYQAGAVGGELSYARLVDSYKSWVYTAIDKIAKSVAVLPLRLFVYRRQGKKIDAPGEIKMTLKGIGTDGERKYALKQMGVEKEEIFAHPFLEMMQRPNGIMTRFMLWYETMIRLELSGSCGWYVLRNVLGVPAGVWPLPLTRSAVLKPKVSARAEILEWEYRDGTLVETFRPEEIIFLKYPHPASPFQGMSPLMAQTYPYDIDLYIMQQQKALYENKGVPGMHLHTKEPLGPEQVTELNDQLIASFSGPLKSGLPFVTHSGLESVKAAFTPREALITQVADWARQKILSAHDLSDGKIGLVKDVNRANMEALNETFVQDCLRPKTMLIEEAIEAFLLPMYDQGLTCDFVLPDIDTREMDVKERTANLTTALTVINEERQKMGLEEVPWGNEPWIPSTWRQPSEERPEPAQVAPRVEPDQEAAEMRPINLYLDIDATTSTKKKGFARRNADGTIMLETTEEEIPKKGNGHGELPAAG